MILKKSIAIFVIAVLLVILVNNVTSKSNYSVFAQQPTGSVPTVTGTPKGPMATIRYGFTEPFVNIRSGPSTLYDAIGIIYMGDQVPVKGKSIGGDWLLIEYYGVEGSSGWVWALYMDVTPGEIPLVEMPPSPQPKVTFTIDPTMASQFITTPLATRLPTYTPPSPLVIPTFETMDTQKFAGIPVGFIIIILLGTGILIALFSYFQSR
jgi:uncharacterized protein YraI